MREQNVSAASVLRRARERGRKRVSVLVCVSVSVRAMHIVTRAIIWTTSA